MKKMELYKSVIFFSFLGYSYCGYTDYTVLLWLSSDENMPPSAVWSNQSSSYNSDTNATIGDLKQTGTHGYRNTLIDSWSNKPPDKIRVAYRNRNGAILYRAKFRSTALSNSEWFTATKAFNGTPQDITYELTQSYSSYSVDFASLNGNLGVDRYRAASLILADDTVVYIVGSAYSTALLPATPTAPGDCYASFMTSNPFNINITTINQTHDFCAALCRERKYPQGGVYGEVCSCLEQAVTGPLLTVCTTPCNGNNEEMCGGSQPPAIVFNSVNTDIDVSQFDKPLLSSETIYVTGNGEVSYPGSLNVYGFNVSISQANLPVTIDMILHYKIEPCNETKIANTTYTKTFSVASGETVYTLEMKPIFAQCVHISLYDNTTSEALAFPVTLTTITIEKNRFITAQLLTIEAAWLTDDEQTTPSPSDECECDCWMYNLLYGDSPFNNMSYTEIQVALKNVTEKIEKELAVNRTSLSSSIRKKTSADDSRPSAAAIGYALGVALLVTSLGAILMADFPKMIESFRKLAGNLKAGFCEHDEN